MLKIVSAGLVTVGLIVATAAVAQQRAPETTGARERAAAFSPDDRQAFSDARIAALKTGLKLTPDQEKNWPAVESALRELSKQRAEVAAQRRENREKRATVDPIERLRNQATVMGDRATGLKRFADAAEPLYRTLDDGQKRRLAVLSRQALAPQWGPRR